MQSILVVEDELDLVELLQFNLRAAGFDVQVATSGADALIAATERTLDLVLLDLMLPDLPGTEVCRKLKASPRTRALPVIMVTARGEEVDRVVGFELGADDFVTKPFSIARAPAARARRAAPRAARRDRAAAHGGGRGAHRPRLAPRLRGGEGGRPHRAGVQAAAQLHVARRPPADRETLLRDVWGISSNLQTRTVDTHVKRLREKLGDGRDLIETVRGAGYRMVDPQEA